MKQTNYPTPRDETHNAGENPPWCASLRESETEADSRPFRIAFSPGCHTGRGGGVSGSDSLVRRNRFDPNPRTNFKALV